MMPEILQIFHQSPPSHNQMHYSHFQRGLVDVESQFNWSFESDGTSPGSFDATDLFQCYEFAGSSLTNCSSSSVDELSKVTAIVEKDHQNSRRKRKLKSVDGHFGLIEPPKARRNIDKGNLKIKMDLKPEPEPDYVHVRARHGQATDSHSLAERARREKIKKKMQYLQSLVPGCKKITNKAAVLDEIITYIQCLHRDVEFLTMKLAALTTSVDFNSLPEEQQIQLSQW